MANEVKVQAEGSLWAVQASGANPTGWVTGTTPVSARIGYVQSFSFTSARDLGTMMDRGVPMHHKHLGAQPIDLTFNFLWTGAQPEPASGGGFTMPMWHLEFKATEKDVGAGSGRYFQFYGAAISQSQFTENKDGNTIALSTKALGMSGSNTTGYMP